GVGVWDISFEIMDLDNNTDALDADISLWILGSVKNFLSQVDSSVIRYGMIPATIFGSQAATSNFGPYGKLASYALPLLIIGTTVYFFASELYSLAKDKDSGALYGLGLGALVVFAGLLVCLFKVKDVTAYWTFNIVGMFLEVLALSAIFLNWGYIKYLLFSIRSLVQFLAVSCFMGIAIDMFQSSAQHIKYMVIVYAFILFILSMLSFYIASDINELNLFNNLIIFHNLK
ncbi:MAG: hypothetical protein ACFE8L_13380, partial [Candidatus Hodarchaeota archaeon]